MDDKKAQSRMYDDLIQNCEEVLKQNSTKYQSYLELQELLRLQFIGTNHDYKRLKKWLDSAYEDFLTTKHTDFTRLYEVLVKHNLVKEFVNFGKKQETLQLKFIETINECVNLKDDLNTANKSVISLKREYSDLTGYNDALLENMLAKESFSFARSLEILRMNFIEIIENSENSQLILETACDGLTKLKSDHDSLKQQYEALSENEMVKGFTDYAKYQENLQQEIAKQAKDPKATLDRINQNIVSLKSQLAETNEMLNGEQQRCQRIENERDSLDKSSEELCFILLNYQRRKSNKNTNRERSMNKKTLENTVMNDNSSFECSDTIRESSSVPDSKTNDDGVETKCLNEPERQLSCADRDGHQPVIMEKKDSNISPKALITAVNESAESPNTHLNDHDSVAKNCDVIDSSSSTNAEQDSLLQSEISNVTNQRKPSKNLKKSLKGDKKSQRKISNLRSNICNQLNSCPDSNVPNEEELYKCTFCDQSFSTRDLLDLHAVVHNLTRPFKGWKFDHSSKSESAKRLLQRDIHAKTAPRFCCAHCDRRFSNKDKLAGHTQRRHLRDLRKRFKCTTCGKSFAIERKLELHKSVKHQPKKDEILRHNICNRTNSNKEIPSKHITAVNKPQKSYKCAECEKTFSRRSNLKEHELTHTSKNLFKCSFCDSRFKYRIARKLHARKYHEEYAHFRCAHCDRRCFSKKSISMHLRKCHPSRLKKHMFACSVCSESFSTKVNLAEHESICSSKTETRKENKSAVVVLKKFEVSSLRCGMCSRLFSCMYSLGGHKRDEHGEPRPFTCITCGMTFCIALTLRRHQVVHSSQRPFKCSHCGKCYKDYATGRQHERKVHEGYRSFICAYCDRPYFSRDRLISHINSLHLSIPRKHLPKPKKSFPCPICGKLFHFARFLKRHQSVHTSQRPYKCSQCDKCFKSVERRRIHERIVHEKLRPFICAYCDKAYPRKDRLIIHMKSCELKSSTSTKSDKSLQSAVHSKTEENVDGSKKPYRCKHCDKSYLHQTSKRNHERDVHERKFRFICAYCDEKFFRKSRLLHHINYRHLSGSLNCFKCTKCNKGFVLKWHWKRHNLLTHKMKSPKTR